MLPFRVPRYNTKNQTAKPDHITDVLSVGQSDRRFSKERARAREVYEGFSDKKTTARLKCTGLWKSFPVSFVLFAITEIKESGLNP